jgi:hypothetical protein
VIYRELFPSGLTLLDKGHLGELGTSHLVARQELRALVAAGPADASEGRAGTGAERTGLIERGHGPPSDTVDPGLHCPAHAYREMALGLVGRIAAIAG